MNYGTLVIYILVMFGENGKEITLSKYMHVRFDEAEGLIKEFAKYNKHVQGFRAQWIPEPVCLDHLCKPTLGQILKDKLEDHRDVAVVPKTKGRVFVDPPVRHVPLNNDDEVA